MTQHIIDTDELVKLVKYGVLLENRERENIILVPDLIAYLSNSPQADGMVLDEHKEVLFGNFGALDFAIEHQESQGNNSIAEGLKALHYALTMLSAYKPQADDVRKDAERYRYFRDAPSISLEKYEPIFLSAEEIDQAIDQAIDKARE